MKLSILCTIVLLALLLIGCKAKQIDWAFECSNRYPVNTVYLQGKESISYDTVTVKGDSVPCPPNSKGEVIYVPCPDTKNINKNSKRTDTLKTPDLAKEAHLQGQIKAANDKLTAKQIELAKEQEKRSQAEETAEKYRKQRNSGYWALLAVGVIAFRRQLYAVIKSMFGLVDPLGLKN